MSWLYHLPIEGAGTSHIEALGSYVLRLAAAHGTSPGVLLKLALARFGAQAELSHRGVLNSCLSAFVRPNQSTAAIVDVLSLATGHAHGVIESMTFMCLESALARSMNTFPARLR